MWYNISNFLVGFFYTLCGIFFIMSVILTIVCGVRFFAGRELFLYHYAAPFVVATCVGLYYAIDDYI